MSIRTAVEVQPWYRLTAHFFAGLFDFGVLSEAGSDAFRRVLIGIAAAMLTFGLLLVRMYAAGTAGPAGTESLRLAGIAGEAVVIGLPMLVVAFATLLISQSLFPDETDFRVLLVLPVTRRTIFLSKLSALALFAGLFIVSSHAAMLPLFLKISAGQWAAGNFSSRLAAHLLASLGASACAVLAITAINGGLLMALPRVHVQTASTAFRSLMLCALVLSVPLAARLPAIGPLVAAESPLLFLAPPAWFLGVNQLLQGHATPYFSELAAVAIGAFVSSLVIAVGSYSLLYRRFDRVMIRPAETGSRGLGTRVLGRAHARRPGFVAIRAFTHVTLARSALHQGVFIAIAACGAGLVLNSFFGASAVPRLRSYEDALSASALWAPFALVFAATIGARAALVLPIDPRANWVFRMTEDATARVEQLNAVVDAVVRLGVVAPLAMLLPIEWAMFGVGALASTSVAFVAGVLLVEIEMSEWQRIPFTCSYMPGKRFVGHTMLIGLAGFVIFTSLGQGLAWYSIHHRWGWLVVMAILGSVVVQRRRRRLALWRRTALIFEDSLPSEIEPLRLSQY